jgi:hypothetical protein
LAGLSRAKIIEEEKEDAQEQVIDFNLPLSDSQISYTRFDVSQSVSPVFHDKWPGDKRIHVPPLVILYKVAIALKNLLPDKSA